jgi:hypothetical protein
MGAASKVAEQQRIAEMNQQENPEIATQATTIVEAPEEVR